MSTDDREAPARPGYSEARQAAANTGEAIARKHLRGIDLLLSLVADLGKADPDTVAAFWQAYVGTIVADGAFQYLDSERQADLLRRMRGTH